MNLSYSVLSATGNTFVVLDVRSKKIDLNDQNFWSGICEKEDVDGLLFLKEGSDHDDFEMMYLNRDGGEVSMCGNGVRALGFFAHFECHFNAEKPFKVKTKNAHYLVDLASTPKVLMTEKYDEESIDIHDLYESKRSFYINTGVPHCVYLVDQVDDVDLIENGQRIRNEKRFPKGCNINFVQMTNEDQVRVRTYERGVEGETLSCGTGIIACAYALINHVQFPLHIQTKGGELRVQKDLEDRGLWLEGKVEKLRSGSLSFS